MSILHTVNTSPFQTHALQQCLTLMAEEDCLLLIEDAVIASDGQHTLFAELTKLDKQARLWVLTPDLAARGIENSLGRKCTYSEFVELVVQHTSQLAW